MSVNIADTSLNVSLPERAKGVGTLADQHADFADREGQLAEPVVSELHSSGLLGMWVPRSAWSRNRSPRLPVDGGSELDPVSSLEVIQNVAYGDPRRVGY